MSGFEVHINSIGPNDFAEKREDEKIIPNLISKNLYLNNLQKSWYPVSDAINNILDKNFLNFLWNKLLNPYIIKVFLIKN